VENRLENGFFDPKNCVASSERMKKTRSLSPAKRQPKLREKKIRKAARPSKPRKGGASIRQKARRNEKPGKAAKTTLKEFALKRGVKLNADQERLFDELMTFLASPDERCFLMKGSAGTGKTFLLKSITSYLKSYLKLQVELAAPTGRAALVLQRVSGARATTIHRLIYALEGLAERKTPTKASQRSPVFFYPVKKLATDNTNTVFIVDEASMVSDKVNKSEFFRWGSGRLLKDLVEFTRVRDPLFNTKIIFVGDPCQLPPPDSGVSSALSADYLANEEFTTEDDRGAQTGQPREKYGLVCREYELTHVERQKEGDILATATELRETINSGQPDHFQFSTRKGHIRQGSIESICAKTCESFKADPSDGIIVTNSNPEAFEVNSSVRQLLWGEERPLCKGDRLLVYQNNRLLTNGELIVVEKVYPLDEHVIEVRSARGDNAQLLRFRKIRYRREDGVRSRKPRTEETMILENFLYGPDPALTPDIFSAIYEDFRRRFAAAKPEIKLGYNFMPRTFVSAMSSDPYVNCAKVKFGYAMTCYKAQGGQWDHVGVITRRSPEDRSVNFLRWVYTAITRARKALSFAGLQEYSPITGLLPSFRPRSLIDPSPGLSLTRRYLETLFQEELNDMGASVAKCSVVNSASKSNKAYKYDITNGAERCVLVFSERKSGRVEKHHFERKSEKLGSLLQNMLERYGANAPAKSS
jgi:hypothetical protein